MFLLQIQKKKSFVFSVFSAIEFPQQSFGEGADLFVDIIEVAGVWGKNVRSLCVLTVLVWRVYLCQTSSFVPLLSFHQHTCTLRGCCWSPQSDTSVPWCFFSSNHGYKVDGSTRFTQAGKLQAELPNLCTCRSPIHTVTSQPVFFPKDSRLR